MAGLMRILHLTFVGAGKSTASVEFGPGSTVVRGPSDTGKSFIVEALDFMLGGGTPPKDIPELAGYDSALLGITLGTGDVVTFARSLRGGDFGVYESDVRTRPTGSPATVLKAKHQANGAASVSSFLMAQMGLNSVRIRQNVNNKTKSFTFRNLALLCVVDETSMQADRSPVLGGITTNATSDAAAFRFVLEGEDDSNLVEVSDPSELRRVSAAQDGVIDRLLADLHGQLEGAPGREELDAQLDRLEGSITKTTSSVSSTSRERSTLLKRIAATEAAVAEGNMQARSMDELEARFSLLGEQYSSDLDRLEMIAEAGSLLSYFAPGPCAFCGASVEHQDHAGQDHRASTNFAASVRREQTKTLQLRADLEDTLSKLRQDRDEVLRRGSALERAIAAARETIEAYDRALLPEQGQLRELTDARRRVEKQRDLHVRAQELLRVRQQLLAEQDRSKAKVADSFDDRVVARFSSLVAQRLAAWGFPKGASAEFDPKLLDVRVGGQARKSHGKGVRAILHAAFTVSVAQYCIEAGLPHPGFVVLDSPLVTYRPPDRGGDSPGVVPESLLERFYADLSSLREVQVLVLENVGPEGSAVEGWREVVFTANDAFGRYGFFPM
jgi:hypothetical protein